MTIDEAVKKQKEIVQDNLEESDRFLKLAEEAKQIADYLDELKAYKQIGTIEKLSNSVLMIEKVLPLIKNIRGLCRDDV